MAKTPKPDSRAARVAENPPSVGERLRSLVQRVERLAEEKSALASDIRDIYKEAQSAGFDTKVLRKVVQRRTRAPSDIATEDDLLDTYELALEGAGSNSFRASVEEDV